MSIRVMTAVWDSGRYEGGELLVLLALADWANDQGECWPSIPSIAKKARLQERQVYNILRKMRMESVISCEPGGGRGNPSRYIINTAMIAGFKESKTLQSGAQKPCNPVHKNPAICNKPPHPLNGRTVKEPLREPPAKTGGGEHIRKAVQSVCLACTFVGKEIEDAIHGAIMQALKHPDCELSAGQIAETMSRRWGEYGDRAHLLRYQLTPVKFFLGGHWRPDSPWPYDQQLLKNRREANVGVHR